MTEGRAGRDSTEVPVAAYNVSGAHAIRGGADIVITHRAKETARWLRQT